ncbi:hypothetical protein [Paraburkholderia sediminicola]|uniref:hypothetical protein n=1 Tax=Paraburkholderia sediminicola TaxID=458836 RepID=UPI0038B8240E
MKYFFDYKLADIYGYGMAVYIAAETSDLQRAIDLTNARRLRAGRRLLEDARIEDVLSAMRNTGLLQAKTDEGGTNVSGATR